MSQSKKKNTQSTNNDEAKTPVVPLSSVEGIKEQLNNQRLLMEDYKARFFASKGAVEMLEAVLKSMLEGDTSKEEKKPNV